MREPSSKDLPADGGGLCRGIARLAGRAAIVAGAISVLAVGYFVLSGSRMAFLRGATLVLDASPSSYGLETPSEVTAAPLEVVISIPAPPMDSAWWSPVSIVDPDALADYTLRHGGGNCAAKSRGLGWWLMGRKIPYRLVYLLSDPGIRHGEGHTMVETAWQQDGKTVVGLLDPLAAGVPMADGIPLDSTRLMHDRGGPSVRYWPDRPDLDALNLRPLQQPARDSAAGNSFVAMSPGSEVSAHLRFMKVLSTFMPDSFMYRAVGMSASLFLGIYPANYVPESESKHVSGLLRIDMWIARVVVWGARATAGLGMVAVISWTCVRWQKRQSTGAFAAGVRS